MLSSFVLIWPCTFLLMTKYFLSVVCSLFDAVIGHMKEFMTTHKIQPHTRVQRDSLTIKDRLV